MPTLTLDSHVARLESALSRVLGGEAVIVDVEGGSYYGLDELGTRIWEQLDGTAPLRQLVQTIVDEYDVTPEVAGADLLRLVGELVARNLARELASPAAG